MNKTRNESNLFKINVSGEAREKKPETEEVALSPSPPTLC